MFEKRNWAAENETVLMKIYENLSTTNKKACFGIKD